MVAGHKGHAVAVQQQGRAGRRKRRSGARGRGPFAQEKPPLVGMIQRGGRVVIPRLENVQPPPIEPVRKPTGVPGSLVYTDDDTIDGRLCAWGYEHKRVNHGVGAYARDEAGDGFCEVHVKTREGFWSLLRSLVTAAARELAGEAPAVSRSFRVCSPYQKTRQSFASFAD
jgi:transposase